MLPTLSDRSSGVLLHPTSLPDDPLGAGARAFMDFLAAGKQRWWQMLPVGPPDFTGSPYSAESAFAGSPALISTDRLIADGLLSPDAHGRPRDAQLQAAYAAFAARGDTAALDEFAHGARAWLEDFALYRALKRAHGGRPWTAWPDDVRDRRPEALRAAHAALADDVARARFEQWRFAGDWTALREHARSRGVGLIGDVPIFVAHDSADVWQHQKLFQLDAAGQPTVVAGVPPDYFSATGQRWGNPMYRWDQMRRSKFAWWTARLGGALARFDAVRLDHFIGFTRAWAIPAAEPTAVNGRWRRGPGAALFTAAAAALGALPLIAEDLGVTTPEVTALRDRFGFPGIKVLQFGFGADAGAATFLPHNYPHRAVAYTGTHDNDTTWGWFHDRGSAARGAQQVAVERLNALRYLGAEDSDGRDIHWRMIRAVLMSVADVAIIPVQDLLGLGSASRMNRPGTDHGNWTFRLPPDALTPALADRLRTLTEIYGRAV